MNIIKFDRAQNKTQNLTPVKCFESKNVPANNCNNKLANIIIILVFVCPYIYIKCFIYIRTIYDCTSYDQ